MPSIKIIEQDLTTGGNGIADTNVVYVPGFMSVKTEDWDEKSTPANSYTPTLCTSVSQFEKCFGKNPYADSGFTDMSYVYAKELLSLGLSVLYESINSKNDTKTSYTLLTKVPDDWTDNYDTYFTKSKVGNKDVYTKVEKGTEVPTFETNKYYKEVVSPTPSETAMTTFLTSNATDGPSLLKLKERGEYQFKYLTTGAYGNFKSSDSDHIIAKNMVDVASNSGERGDCIVLIDHENNADAALDKNSAPYNKIIEWAKGLTEGADSCAAFTPWVNVFPTTYVTLDADKKPVPATMPPSFAYLSALAVSLRTNASWMAVAGVTRGQIPNLSSSNPLNLNKILTNSIAESLQNRGDENGSVGVSINAITNIKPFGYRIWGNRTLKNNLDTKGLTATSFLNVKTLVCDVKKIVWDACRKYMFEQNNDVLWLNFKSYIEPTLDRMKTGAGLSGYKIIQNTVTDKAKLSATIKLYPIYAVEDFEVTVQMLDDEISVS